MRIDVGELIYEHSLVSGEPFPLDTTSWAIHGFIPVDGDVILAKFDSQNDAQAAIAQLWETDSP